MKTSDHDAKKSYEKPLAYFITFRTYGTWHHGDERLSVDRVRNIHNTPKINPNKNLKKQMQELQQHDSIIFTQVQADIILESFVTACNKYNWRLYSLHIRTNHVHLTVKSDNRPEHVMTELKAYATRLLRKRGAFKAEQKIWSRHGSTKYIWTPESLYFSSDYTIEQQGQKMAYFFNP